MPLKIKPCSDCQLDVLSFGECMIRLSPPGHQRIELTPVFEAWAGGGEYNVSYALSRLGLRTAWVSRLVDNPLGWFIRNHARTSGMDLSHVVWAPYDGVGNADRIGLNFTEVGIGVRGSVTMYDRGHSAAAHIKPGDVDWKQIFSERGVRWFHTGGICTALSDSSAAVVKEAMQAAHEAGTVVSYDLNFRSKLWPSEKATAVTRELVPFIDVLIGNEEDFQKVLGFQVEGVDEALKKLPVEGYKSMVARVVEKFIMQLETQLGDRQVEIEMSEAAKAWLAAKGYDKLYGARPLARVIQDKVKKPLAEELLFGKLAKGGSVKIDVENDKLTFAFVEGDSTTPRETELVD